MHKENERGNAFKSLQFQLLLQSDAILMKSKYKVKTSKFHPPSIIGAVKKTAN